MAEILDIHGRRAGIDDDLCGFLTEVANYIATHYRGINFCVGAAEPPATDDAEPVAIALTNADPFQQAALAACLLYEYPKSGGVAELQGFDGAVREIMGEAEQDSVAPQYD